MMTTPRNPNNVNNTYAVWVFQGHRFNKGVLSALRAYPEVQRLQSLTVNEDEFLVLELSQRVADPNSFVSVITLAGGEVMGIHASESSLEDMIQALINNSPDESQSDEFPCID